MSTTIFVILEARQEEFFRGILESAFSGWSVRNDQKNFIIANNLYILSLHRYSWSAYASLSESDEADTLESIARSLCDAPIAYYINTNKRKLIIDLLEILSVGLDCFVDNDHGAIIDVKSAIEEIKINDRWLR